MAIKTRTSGIMIPAYVATVAGAYQGPGDILGDAISWWGVRAFKNSMIPNVAIRISRASDSAEKDISTTTGGGLDLSDGAFFDGGPYTVVKWYDQSGNGSHLSNIVAGLRPAFTPSGLGSNSVVTFTAATPTYFNSELNPPNTAQPISYAAVAKNNAGTSYEYFLHAVTINTDFAVNPNTPIFYVFAGGGTGAFQSATTGNFHAVEALLSGASSFVVVDGSAGATAESGANGITNAWQVGNSTDDPGHAFDGAICELGAWAGNKSALFASADSAARTFYGLP